MDEDVVIRLSRDEALVLYDWLARLNKAGKGLFEDQSEQRALWNLEAILESTLAEPLSSDYREKVTGARANLRDPQD